MAPSLGRASQRQKLLVALEKLWLGLVEALNDVPHQLTGIILELLR